LILDRSIGSVWNQLLRAKRAENNVKKLSKNLLSWLSWKRPRRWKFFNSEMLEFMISPILHSQLLVIRGQK